MSATKGLYKEMITYLNIIVLEITTVETSYADIQKFNTANFIHPHA